METARATARATRPTAKHSNLEKPKDPKPICASVAATTPTPAGAGASPPSSSVPSSNEGHSKAFDDWIFFSDGVSVVENAVRRLAVAAAESAGNTNAPALSGTNGAGKYAVAKIFSSSASASASSSRSFFGAEEDTTTASSVFATASSSSSSDPQSPQSASANASEPEPRGSETDAYFSARVGVSAAFFFVIRNSSLFADRLDRLARIAETATRSARSCFALASLAISFVAETEAPAARAAALASASCASAVAAAATRTREVSGLRFTSSSTSGATVFSNLCVKITKRVSFGRGAPATSRRGARR